MKKIAALIGFLFIVSLCLPVVAQDDLKCDADQLTIATDAIEVTNTAAKEAIASGDLAGAVEQLTALKSQLATLQIACSGMSFEGKSAKLLGPIHFEKGLYRAVVTTTGFMSITLKVTEGTCKAGMLGDLLFNLFNDQATEGSEALIESDGCTALLNMQQSTSNWTLTIEKIG